MIKLKDAQFTAQELREAIKDQQLLDSTSANDTKDNEIKYEVVKGLD